MSEPKFQVLYNRLEQLRLNLFDCSAFLDRKKCDTYDNLIVDLMEKAPIPILEKITSMSRKQIIELIRPQVEQKMKTFPKE